MKHAKLLGRNVGILGRSLHDFSQKLLGGGLVLEIRNVRLSKYSSIPGNRNHGF